MRGSGGVWGSRLSASLLLPPVSSCTKHFSFPTSKTDTTIPPFRTMSESRDKKFRLSLPQRARNWSPAPLFVQPSLRRGPRGITSRRARSRSGGPGSPRTCGSEQARPGSLRDAQKADRPAQRPPGASAVPTAPRFALREEPGARLLAARRDVTRARRSPSVLAAGVAPALRSCRLWRVAPRAAAPQRRVPGRSGCRSQVGRVWTGPGGCLRRGQRWTQVALCFGGA